MALPYENFVVAVKILLVILLVMVGVMYFKPRFQWLDTSLHTAPVSTTLGEFKTRRVSWRLVNKNGEEVWCLWKVEIEIQNEPNYSANAASYILLPPSTATPDTDWQLTKPIDSPASILLPPSTATPDTDWQLTKPIDSPASSGTVVVFSLYDADGFELANSEKKLKPFSGEEKKDLQGKFKISRDLALLAHRASINAQPVKGSPYPP